MNRSSKEEKRNGKDRVEANSYLDAWIIELSGTEEQIERAKREI
jgi:hypothetical protein